MSDIIGIGTDIIEISRFKASLERQGDSFLKRLFTSEEQQYCKAHKEQALRFAARFAAKEAVAKALGCGIGKLLGWHDIVVRNTDSGAVEAMLSAEAKKRFKDISIKLSISHEEHYAIAFAIALK